MSNNNFTFDQRLDTDFLLSIYEDDLEHAELIFEQFLVVAPVQMKEIDESFESGNVEIFRQRLHKLKPVFSFVGLTWLTTKAEMLEKRCKEISNLIEVKELYYDLKKNHFECIPIIKEELLRLKG